MNIKLRLVFVLFLLSSVYVQAQVPVNDLCEDAITVVCGDVVQGNTEQSTNASSPEDGCGTTNGAPGNWYFFEGNGDIVDLSLCSVTDYDTKIRVYSGNCFSLTCVGGNDDSCGLRSEFTFTSDASTNYFIYVFGFGAGTGDYELTLTCTSPPPPPANDDCDGAITALVNENENCTLINPGTLEGATTSNVPNTCPGTANDDVWFQFTATATSHLIQFDNIQGAPTNINHAVFEGVDCDSLINISCSDPNQSLVQNLTIGDTYYIRVYSSGTIPFVTTTFDLCISQLPEPPVNDECDEAIVVAVNTDDTCTLTTAGALGGATDSNIVNGCGGFADDDVWFSFTADSSIHIIELLNVAGSPTDVTFSIFEGPCDTLAEFACSNGLEAFVPGLTIGQDYFIRVFTEGANPINNTTFDVCVRQAITEVLCDGEPTTGTTCYDNNNTTPISFEGDAAFPLRLTFIAGEVENAFDELIVLDSDGVTNLNPDTPYGNNGDISGLQFTATGNTISFFVQADGSVSCVSSAAIDPIEYEVTCLQCTAPEITFELVGACEPVAEFFVEANITDLGSEASITLTDNLGNPAQTATTTGVVTFGPYVPNVDMVMITADPGDADCIVMSESFTFGCVTEGCYDILDAGEDVFLTCEEPCVELTATIIVEPNLTTSEYIINGPICDVPPVEGGTPTNLIIDDTWSEVIDLPFDFNYFTNDYNQIVVGANGQISFDPTLAGGFNGWNSEPDDLLPVTDGNFPLNTIYGAFHDLNPGTNPDPTRINFYIAGTAPFRVFVLNFNEVPHFSCGDLLTTQQILLYESLNMIDVNIINKPTCLTWNDGLATLGLMGNDLTEFSVPDGRNTGPWEASNETWRFVPAGEQETASNFSWQDANGNVLSEDLVFEACPQGTTSYFATLEVELSDGSIEIIQEEVIVERETGCINFDCTDTLLFETFGTGTGAATDPFVTIPFDGIGGLAEGAYVISNTLVGLNPFWHFDLEDHTPDDTDGRMLIINASGNDANAELYRRPLTLETNTEYGLRFWLATVYDIETNICPENGGLGIPSNLIYQIEAPDGTIIASGTTGDVDNTAEPLWQPFNLEFNSGTNTDVELVFINNILGVCGNDFAIDDIGLFFEGEPPVIVMPEDISECDEDENGQVIFDLTAQNAEILDGLDPADFAIFFYNSEEDAINRNNPIVTPGAYTNVSDPETIWVRVERANQDSCFSITSFQISLEPQVDLGVMFDPFFEICSNEAFPAIDGTPTNPDIDISGFEYEWRDANGTIVATTAIFVPTQGGVYTLVITGDFCGEDTFITEVVVQPAPVLDLGPTQTFCEGEQAFEIIPIITGDTTGITYQWSTGETTETIIVNETGTYTLTITVGLCTVTNSVDVNFLENPIVDLGADFKSCPGEVTLTATIVNEEEGVNYSYIWFGPDGEISGETQATLVTTIDPDLLGAVVFSVVVLNGDCEGTDEVEISLYDIDNCIISQGISPNGDSLNDMLDLEFLNDRSGIDNLKIFNRLGTLVYERNNYINEWFGQTTDGEELPTGTYYYVIALENEDMTYGREAAGFIYLNREP